MRTRLLQSRLADDAIETEPLSAHGRRGGGRARCTACVGDVTSGPWIGLLVRSVNALGGVPAPSGGDDVGRRKGTARATAQGGCGAGQCRAALAEAERAAFADRSATRTRRWWRCCPMHGAAGRRGHRRGAADLIGEVSLLQAVGRERRSLDEQAAIVELAFVLAGQLVAGRWTGCRGPRGGRRGPSQAWGMASTRSAGLERRLFCADGDRPAASRADPGAAGEGGQDPEQDSERLGLTISAGSTSRSADARRQPGATRLSGSVHAGDREAALSAARKSAAILNNRALSAVPSRRVSARSRAVAQQSRLTTA